MSDDFRGKLIALLVTPEPPELGPGPRRDVRSTGELDAALNSLPRDEAVVSDMRLQLIRALVLLWHDHLDASHRISQYIESADGSFVHAIMHRRESDYWNSKYWWRRVGKHPCFPEIARRVGSLLNSRAAGQFARTLIRGGEWDASAFVDACQAAVGVLPADERVQLLREIQKIETEVLLEYFGRP